MEINFSRHAKRRMRLYKIPEEDVIDTIRNYTTNIEFVSDKKEIVNEELSKKYGYPLKIVFIWEDDRITVITAYLLKRGLAQ